LTVDKVIAMIEGRLFMAHSVFLRRLPSAVNSLHYFYHFSRRSLLLKLSSMGGMTAAS